MRIQIRTNLIDLRASLMNARAFLPTLLHEAATETGTLVAEELKVAAPVGKGESSSPPGDAEGRLADSFFVQDEIVNAESATVAVKTNQPIKLKFVVKGRGTVLPVNKHALYWKELGYPVRRAGPSKANDFVTPVLDAAPDAEEGLMTAFDEFRTTLEGA
jgi:hypothetical protein